MAVQACNWNVNDNRHSNALVGCVQSTLEAPISARAGGSPAPNGASQTSGVDRCSVLKRCVISARQHRRTVASEDASAGETPAAPPISAMHSPADSDSGCLVRFSVAAARWTSGNGSDASDHLATFLSTVESVAPSGTRDPRSSLNPQHAEPERPSACQQTRGLTMSADGGQSFRTILGVLSVVACGLAGLLVLACGAMGGEQ
jgi:hypothetical protein